MSALVDDGADPIVCDLETASDGDVDTSVAGADALVFAAGAGRPARRRAGPHDRSARRAERESGTGLVNIGRSLQRGEITRDDVAWVLAATIHEPGTVQRTFELIGGDTPVPEAVAAVAAAISPD
ncbi:MAG: hypothetical protein ACR2HV_02990 [Acidimicrobiales bacterium]